MAPIRCRNGGIIMNRLFELGNRYAEKSTWKDFALTKLCVFSMGIAAGAMLPKKYRNAVIGISALGFAASYLPLMLKVLRTAEEMKED